jgi:hypothetical protein
MRPYTFPVHIEISLPRPRELNQKRSIIQSMILMIDPFEGYILEVNSKYSEMIFNKIILNR